MSNVLVIVDVQKQFKEYMQHDLVKELGNYANTFDSVYQIWDTHDNAVQPSYKFPKQVDCVPKLFGKNFFSGKVSRYIKSIEDSTDNGKVFKLSDGEGYVIRVTNNHDWFHINPEIVEMIGKIKNDVVTIVGGAETECIEDVFQALLSFGVNVTMNKKYVYSAKTSQQDSVKENKIMSFSEFCKINENRKMKLHYEFKCTDADEDGIFQDTPFGEIDTNEFSQFIEDIEEHEITQDEFKQRFILSVEILDIINNAETEYLQFYTDSESGYVVLFDGDTHFVFSM